VKRFLFLLVSAAVAASGAAGAGTARVASPPTKAVRVTADVDLQVVRHPGGGSGWTRVGVAHLTVDATDGNPSAPLDSGPQDGDEGFITCESADPLACYIAQGSIAWVQVQSKDEVTISTGIYVLTLHDGGNPGSRSTGLTSGSGDAETSDFALFGDWGGLAHFDAWVVSGNVKIH